MKLTIGEILDLNANLSLASAANGGSKFNYAIGKNLLKLKKIVAEFNDERDVLVTAYNIPKTNKGFDFDSVPEAKEKLLELLKVEKDIEDLHTIELSEEVQSVLTGGLIFALDLIIKDVQ